MASSRSRLCMHMGMHVSAENAGGEGTNPHPFPLKAGLVYLDDLKDAAMMSDMADLCVPCNCFFPLFLLKGRNPSLFLFICDAAVRIKCNLLGQ